MAAVSTAAGAIETLRSTLRGRVIEPGDPDFETLATVVPGDVHARPAAIARVADAHDVARVVSVARDTGVELAIRCGGHSGAGHGTTDGGIVLDLRELKTLEIDPQRRTASAEAGLTAAEVTAAAAENGLAVGFGDTGSVGIGGITVGGGIGYLVRKHGLTIDSLLAADVVLADGSAVTASETEHPDLFWALRGGGGNFGVVTRFVYRLHPLPAFTGGMLILPASADAIAGWIAASEAAPDELSTIANVMPAPPMPFLPDEVHGRLVILGMVAYAGEAAAADVAIAPLRALGTPLADMVRAMPYPEMYPPDEEEYHPTAVARTMFVDRIDLPVARTIMSHLERSDAAMRVAQLRVLGGAAARVPADATAYAHRASRIMVNVAAFYDGREDRAVRQQWVDQFVTDLQQDDRGAYVNFLLDEGEERVHAAYPGATWDRLAAVKRRYDPQNVFRRNHNIRPAAA